MLYPTIYVYCVAKGKSLGHAYLLSYYNDGISWFYQSIISMHPLPLCSILIGSIVLAMRARRVPIRTKRWRRGGGGGGGGGDI